MPIRYRERLAIVMRSFPTNYFTGETSTAHPESASLFNEKWNEKTKNKNGDPAKPDFFFAYFPTMKHNSVL